jgi:hypothetical protein
VDHPRCLLLLPCCLLACNAGEIHELREELAAWTGPRRRRR